MDLTIDNGTGDPVYIAWPLSFVADNAALLEKCNTPLSMEDINSIQERWPSFIRDAAALIGVEPVELRRNLQERKLVVELQ